MRPSRRKLQKLTLSVAPLVAAPDGGSPASRPAPCITVEGCAILHGRRRWLSLGEAQIIATEAGPKLRLALVAVPYDGQLYLSLTDVRRLDLLLREAAAAPQPEALSH